MTGEGATDVPHRRQGILGGQLDGLELQARLDILTGNAPPGRQTSTGYAECGIAERNGIAVALEVGGL